MQKRHLTKSNTLSPPKTLRKLEIEGNFLNMIKGIYKNHTANIIVSGERLKLFP